MSYLSSRATVFPGFELKDNCFILEDNTIQPFARVGSNVTLWSGNHIGHHSTIDDDVFVASHVVLSGGVRIGQGSFVGVNVTIRDRVTIGRKCVLGAGALVLEDQPDFSVVAPRGTGRSKVPSTRLRGCERPNVVAAPRLGLCSRRSSTWARSHAALPLPVQIGGNIFRMFFSSRDAKHRSHVGWVDVDLS